MKTPSQLKNLFKPLITALVLFAASGAVSALLYAARKNGIQSPLLFNVGEKAITLFSALGVLFLIRWLVADAPFKFLQKYTAAPIAKTLINLLLYFGAAMFLLNKLLKINLMPLLTTSAVLTGIMVLSLQETLKNLFTGLWINMERIVAKGDWVRIGEKEGRIMEVTWRTTRLMTREDDCIFLPNRLLAEGTLENYTYPTARHVVCIDIGASYKDAPNLVRAVLLAVAAETQSALKDPAPDVWLLSYGDFSVNYRLRVWVNDFEIVPEVKTEIYGKIWYSFRRHRIEIPYPARTVYQRAEETEEKEEVSYARDFITGSLRGVDFLSPLKEDELLSVASNARVVVFGQGEVIVRQGEPGDTCYILQEGSAEIVLRDSYGSESIVATLRQGGFFGEMSLLTGEPRSATVKAKDDCTCIVIGSKAFQTIFRENPGITERLSALLAERSSELDEAKAKTESKAGAGQDIQRHILNRIKRFFKM